MNRLLQDLRYAVRNSEKEPGLLLGRRANSWAGHWSQHCHFQHGGLAGATVVADQGSAADAFSGFYTAWR